MKQILSSSLPFSRVFFSFLKDLSFSRHKVQGSTLGSFLSLSLFYFLLFHEREEEEYDREERRGGREEGMECRSQIGERLK